MADTIRCELVVTGTADVVGEIDRIIADSFMFADLVPMPDGLVFGRPDRRNIPALPNGWADPAWGYARRQIEAGIRQVPAVDNASDWMLRNWGQNRPRPQHLVRHEVPDEATRHYTFDTAWAAPLELVLGMSRRFSAVSLDLRYAGGTGEAGRAVFANGRVMLDEHWDGREANGQLWIIGSRLDTDFDAE
jgi:hypothetical protein